jgi:hypothetical protein
MERAPSEWISMGQELGFSLDWTTVYAGAVRNESMYL